MIETDVCECTVIHEDVVEKCGAYEKPTGRPLSNRSPRPAQRGGKVITRSVCKPAGGFN
jgi:hypothetical protein